MESSPGFLGNPFGSMPRARTPATPARPRIIGRPSAAFRLVNGVGIATSRVFGAESSRPASLLCTLRTHQSPGERQHSLPVCLLDCDRAGLSPAGFHQEVSPSHLRFLLFQTFPSAITTSVVSRNLGFHFSKSVHTFPSAQTHWLLRESTDLASMILYPTAWLGPFAASLWWRSPPDISSVTSIMMCYANSPPTGRRVAYSVDPVTAVQDHCCLSGIPAWAFPFCRNLPRRQNCS